MKTISLGRKWELVRTSRADWDHIAVVLFMFLMGSRAAAALPALVLWVVLQLNALRTARAEA